MDLSEDDVLEILKLFEQSKFDFLHLEQGALKITVSKSGYAGAGAGAAPPAVSAAPAASAAASAPTPVATAEWPKPAVAAAVESGLVPVSAPMVGTFYAAPSPQDPAYVNVGDRVEAGATLGLIEVMKVFASVKTEVSGVVEKILVSNAQGVEFGQTLFLIRPDAAAA